MLCRSFVMILAATVVAAGCSDSSAPSPAASNQRANVATPSADSNQAIAHVADAFMRAIVTGDAASAAELLTDKASRRYAADPSVLTPMRLEVDQLSIGEVRLLNADEAAAQCVVQERGAERPQELCCLLKRDRAGWRVCGMASDGVDGETAVISFEGSPAQPAVQLVDEAGQGRPSARTAAHPGDGATR